MVGQINLMANCLQVRNQRPISPNQKKKKKKLIKQRSNTIKKKFQILKYFERTQKYKF